jgi:hypothetical protein
VRASWRRRECFFIRGGSGPCGRHGHATSAFFIRGRVAWRACQSATRRRCSLHFSSGGGSRPAWPGLRRNGGRRTLVSDDLSRRRQGPAQSLEPSRLRRFGRAGPGDLDSGVVLFLARSIAMTAGGGRVFQSCRFGTRVIIMLGAIRHVHRGIAKSVVDFKRFLQQRANKRAALPIRDVPTEFTNEVLRKANQQLFGWHGRASAEISTLKFQHRYLNRRGKPLVSRISDHYASATALYGCSHLSR